MVVHTAIVPVPDVRVDTLSGMFNPRKTIYAQVQYNDIAGLAKGVRLAPVPAGTRPMADRVREGLFSSLGEQVMGASVLDLFAGTGAVGIEALSRGAARALFVDSAPAAVKTIRENLRRTKLERLASVRRLDALAAVRQKPGEFGVVFVDPPYRIYPEYLKALLDEALA